MYTPWVNLLLASGAAHSTTAVDKALNSTIHAVSASVQTVHTTSQTVSQWGLLRKDLAGTMRDILRPIYDWCIDDTLVPSSAFSVPTPPPSAFWNANAEVRPSLAPSPSSIPESLPTSSAAPLPKRIPSPIPASRPQPSVVISGWGRWRIASPTVTPAPPNSPINIYTPTSTHDPRLGPVAMPRAASSQSYPSSHTSSGFIGPRLPTSPIGSFNGTELPIPNYACSPDHRPPKPRYIWTRRPKCPFNSGGLPEYIVCPLPVGVFEHKAIFLDAPGDSRDPIIDLGPALDTIPLYFESIVVQKRSLRPVQRTPPIHDSIWFKVGAVALTFLFVYVLYLGPPGEELERVDLFNVAVDVVIAEYHVASAKIKEIITSFPPLFLPDDIAVVEQNLMSEATNAAVDVVCVNYWNSVRQTATGFFAGITRIVIISWLSIIGTIQCLFARITRVVVSLWNLFTMMVKSIITVFLGLFIALWNLVRKSIECVFVAMSRAVIGTCVTAQDIVKYSFRIVKNLLAYVSLSRSLGRVTEQPTSPSDLPPFNDSNPLDVPTESPAINPTTAQTTEQNEAGPSNSQSPVKLRSLPRGVADAIKAGNAAPSQVRRAGGRRVNMARPVRTTTSSLDH